MLTKDATINILQLKPHPAGGFFCRTDELSPQTDNANSDRSLTAFYYLLEANTRVMFEKLHAEKSMTFHWGDPLDLYLLTPSESQESAQMKIQTLGMDLVSGQRPQYTIPAGCVYGAKCHPTVQINPGSRKPIGFTLISFHTSQDNLNQNQLVSPEDIQNRYGAIPGFRYFFE